MKQTDKRRIVYKGDVFGKLTALETVVTNGDNRVEVQCECGRVCDRDALLLFKGKHTSCDLDKCNPYFHDMTGKKFQTWTPVERVVKFAQSYWKCICDCGKEEILSLSSVKRGVHKCCKCNAANISYERLQFLAQNQIFLSYKRNASVRGFRIEMPENHFKEMFLRECFYCKSKPNSLRIVSQYRKYNITPVKYNGVDRINNNLGYSESNCVTCCKDCNFAKLNVSIEEFVAWIERLKTYRSNAQLFPSLEA